MAEKNILVCRTTTSLSSVIGNVTMMMMKHIESKFPKDYFKSSYVSTTLGSIQQYNKSGVYKSQLPKLFMKPEYDLNDNTFFDLIPRWHRANEFLFKNLPRYYKPLLINDEDKFYLYIVPDRLKLNFEVKVRVSSIMQQINFMNYLKHSFNLNGYFFINDVPLEAEVPKTFIQVMAEAKGLDLNKYSLGDIEVMNFNEYLKTFSYGHIVPKKNLADGNLMYSSKYSSNILVKVETPSANVDRKGMVDGDPEITFNVSSELWIPCNYIFETIETPSPEIIDDTDVMDRDHIILNYTVKTTPDKTIGDKTLLSWQGFITDANVDVDRLEISDVIEDNIKKIISYNIDNGIDNYSIFDIVLYKDEHKLVRDEHFTFNWETLTLNTLNPYYNMTYHVGLYGNLGKLHETLEILTNK